MANKLFIFADDSIPWYIFVSVGTPIAVAVTTAIAVIMIRWVLKGKRKIQPCRVVEVLPAVERDVTPQKTKKKDLGPIERCI